MLKYAYFGPMKMNTLPPAFVVQMEQQLGAEAAAFFEALQQPAPVSLRYNPAKHLHTQPFTNPVPWCTEGHYLLERPVFTLDPAWHAGAYYVQEAASMFVAEAIRQTTDLQGYLRALDLCAAPGGKTTLLATLLPEGSFLLSNEVIRNRYQILQENCTKWGYPTVHTTNADSSDFQAFSGFFDLVLVDAPCSGEGLFRKDPKAVGEWSLSNVQHCAARQRRILADAVALVRAGGTLVYCTCTYNDTENESNAAWLAETFNLAPLPLQLPAEWGIVSKGIGYQLYPHRVRGEGFYIACFRHLEPSTAAPWRSKSSAFRHLKPVATRYVPALRQWLQQPERYELLEDATGRILAIDAMQLSDCQRVEDYIRRSHLGLEMGLFKNRDFVPAHELALSTALAEDVAAVTLDKHQALHFLKKDNFDLSDLPKGWVLARFNHVGIGWLKGLGNRMNNYLPKNWRIRMDINQE